MSLPTLLSITAAFTLGACASAPHLPTDRPDDFSVIYGWSTGSLPPQYHHSVRLDIAPDGSGSLRGASAYGQGPTETWAFALSPTDLDALYADLHAAGLFRSWSEDGDPPIGGSSWWAEAKARGQTVEVPPFVVRGQGDAKMAVEDILRSAAPAEVWAAHAAWLTETQRTLAADDG